ncbi:MAG: WD40/YVTN/BNR-like repeat-containing protein [Acidimicrobiia bacterium]
MPVLVAGAALVAVTAAVMLTRGSDGPRGGAAAGGVAPAAAAIGGDLHSLAADPADPARLFVGGHQAVGESTDGGRTWRLVDSLANADAMGWAFDATTVWVSGHPGLNHSTDGGRTFRRANAGLPDTDVHAFGASGPHLYGASPAVGVFASSDGGATWEVRTREAGQAFFGRILVDPRDLAHLVAADARAGPVESADGGRTWRRLGGMAAATWVAWAGGDPSRLVASGPRGAARSSDGGRSWEPLFLPEGASLVEASPADAERLYAAVLSDGRASVWASADGGRTWARP